jgi:hypothetical protein
VEGKSCNLDCLVQVDVSIEILRIAFSKKRFNSHRCKPIVQLSNSISHEPVRPMYNDLDHRYCLDGSETVCYAQGRSSETPCPRGLVSWDGIPSLVRSLRGQDFRHPRFRFTCIPSSVETIDQFYLNRAWALVAVAFERGSHLSRIAEYAFVLCPSLLSICIPSCCMTIGQTCFSSSNLLSVLFDHYCSMGLRGSLQGSFEERAFDECRFLQSICIPSFIQRIGAYCFNQCSSLFLLTFESGSTLSSIGCAAFAKCTALRAVSLPSSVETLGISSFNSCVSLAEVTFEAGSKVSQIGNSAFSHCLALQSLCIPRSVSSLGDSCFGQCESLRTVTFESGSRLSYVGVSPFRYCKVLESIFIPLSIERYFPRYDWDLRICEDADEDGESEQPGMNDASCKRDKTPRFIVSRKALFPF